MLRIYLQEIALGDGEYGVDFVEQAEGVFVEGGGGVTHQLLQDVKQDAMKTRGNFFKNINVFEYGHFDLSIGYIQF